MQTTNGLTLTSAEDMGKAREWAGRFLAGPADLPISFVYDGKPIRGIPAAWNPTTTRRRIDANLVETVFEGTDPATGLRIRAEGVMYEDYPVVEWTAWLTNPGHAPTPIISDLLGLDGMFGGASTGLYHCNGDFNSADGYTPQESPLRSGDALAFAPTGGRPCDGAFPYFRILFKDGGLTLSVGWPGQWSATFEGLADGVRVQAGQEKTHLRLNPGETVRTPRMTVLAWSGDASRAVNLWRRWYLAHVLPRPNGQPLQPHLAWSGPGEGIEFTAATEENQAEYIDLARRRGIPFDVWWIDAGWYPCYDANHERKWPVTGSWEPDPERFPNGLKPVSDHAAGKGADLLIWFEPERVRPGTRLDVERPEWLLRVEGAENRLLNLGIPACRQWLTDHVCGLIQDNGIKIYRQDFNFKPLDYWRLNEGPDRQGMNENLHIQGYLQYWDDLLARNPGLWLDSCASGGRRNDLETLRRSVPLHYTDHGYGDHPTKLAFQRTMHEWMPYFKESELSWDLDGKSRYIQRVDSFAYHCGMAALFGTGLDVRRDDYDYALAARMLGIWQRAAELLLFGDYFPLTPFHRDAGRWVARQFDWPERGCGYIQGIRLAQCPEETLTVFPQVTSPGSTYRLENSETGASQVVSGIDLARDGFTFALPRRSAALWFYRVEPSDTPIGP